MSIGFDFEKSKGHDEWLTPPEIISALGEFDLDPCAPIIRPFETAKNYFTREDNGLRQSWFGRVWCNPPYGTETYHWLVRCAIHNNAIALIFARTETKMFFDCIWDKASALLFLRGRLSFYKVTGEKGGTAGSPSVLVAYGKNNIDSLKNCGLNGKLIILQK